MRVVFFLLLLLLLLLLMQTPCAGQPLLLRQCAAARQS
jgi:hypothetical protein